MNDNLYIYQKSQKNQIIEGWKQGIEDHEYEVFPTKKGKSIVRLRDTSFGIHVNKPAAVSQIKDYTKCSKYSEDKIISQQQENIESTGLNVSSIHKNSFRRTEYRWSFRKKKTRMPYKIVKICEVYRRIIHRSSDQFRNIRSLGEEIRNYRLLKEQKNYIKDVANKELNKPRIRSKYMFQIYYPFKNSLRFPFKNSLLITHARYSQK